jgi:hypothetical protein
MNIFRRWKLKQNILIINGSLGGKDGNSAIISKKIVETLASLNITFTELCVTKDSTIEEISHQFKMASAFIFLSGTYWDSWGSPLQHFLEMSTELEGTSLILGKPASVIITMHSVGGKEVLSRLQGVLSTQGYLIPPMSAMALSLVSQIASNQQNNSFKNDFWSLDDLPIIIHNLLASTKMKNEFLSWEVDRNDPKRKWIEY